MGKELRRRSIKSKRGWKQGLYKRLFMLIVQQNCSKEYEYTISVLEAGLGLDAAIVYVQEPFLENKNISYLGFNLYWLSKTSNQKDMRVLIVV